MRIPCVLLPSTLFCTEASAQHATNKSCGSWTCINILCFLSHLVLYMSLFVSSRVETVLVVTLDNKRPTAAPICVLVCWAHQLKAPSAARSCVFSRSLVRELGSRRRSEHIEISFRSSRYCDRLIHFITPFRSFLDLDSTLSEIVPFPSSPIKLLSNLVTQVGPCLVTFTPAKKKVVNMSTYESYQPAIL